MNLRAEYEKHLAAQQALPKLDAKARSFGSTTSDRRRAAAARREADPKQFQKKVAEAYAQETRAINSIMPSELQAAVLALVRREMKNMLPHPLRGLTDNYTNYASPLIATLDSEGEAYWGPGDGGDSAAEYASYFKVIDASDGDGCKIGVTSGGAVAAGICGVVKINNEQAAVEAVTEALSGAGTYYVWIHSWIDAVDGAQAEIIVGAADDDDPPDNPNGGIAFANQLAGRVTVAKDDNDKLSISQITQDYLRGGEHFELLFGDCAGEHL